MTPQLIKRALILLACLLLVLVLVNVFIFMPQLRRGPDQPLVTGSDGQPGIAARDNISSVDTLKAIREGQTANDLYALYTKEEYSRNPFFWPHEKTVQSQKDKPETQKPQLSMVIIGEHQKQALLDDVFIREGDMFHDYRVKRITRNEVILAGDLGDISIALASGRKDDKAIPANGEVGIIER